MSKTVTLTEDELDELIRKASRETGLETFTLLGIDITEPIEAQKDFHFLSETRRASDEIKAKGLLALLGIMGTGILAALWIGIKQVMKNGGP